MKGPRLIRPLMLLGLVLVAIVVINWIINPGWQSSTLGIVIHLGAFFLGMAVVIADFRSFAQEIREMQKRK